MAKWAKWAFKDEFRLSTCSSLRSLQGGIFDGSILWFLKALKNGLNGLTNIISKSIIYDGFLKQASISWELENRSPLNKALAKKRKKLPGIFFFYFVAPQMSTTSSLLCFGSFAIKHSNQVEDFQKLMDDWKHHQVDNCSFQTHHFPSLRIFTLLLRFSEPHNGWKPSQNCLKAQFYS